MSIYLDGPNKRVIIFSVDSSTHSIFDTLNP